MALSAPLRLVPRYPLPFLGEYGESLLVVEEFLETRSEIGAVPNSCGVIRGDAPPTVNPELCCVLHTLSDSCFRTNREENRADCRLTHGGAPSIVLYAPWTIFFRLPARLACQLI